MALPKELTTITLVSKIVAAIYFITLPVLGFTLGMRYQEQLDLLKEKANIIAFCRSNSPATINKITLKTYSNPELGYSFKYPSKSTLEETDVKMLFQGKPLKVVWIDKQIEIIPSDVGPEKRHYDHVISSNKPITVNTIEGKKLIGYIGSVGGSTPQNFQEVSIYHKNVYYIITLYELKKDEKGAPDRKLGNIPKKQIELFNSIVSSFTFL